MAELLLPLIVGLASTGLLVVAWRSWNARSERMSRSREEAVRTDEIRPERREAMAPPDPVARFRDRPLDAVGARRALPRRARAGGVCPVCGRTLVPATRRCPGCRTYLVDGVPLRRAAGFAVRGGALGVLVGVFGGLLLASQLPLSERAGLASVPGVPPAASSPVPAPAGVRAALDSALAVHARLAPARDALRALLDAPQPDADGIDGQLRAIDIEAAEAIGLAAVLERWAGSEDLAAELRTFHGRIRESAAAGLGGEAAVARSAALGVVRVLDGLEAIDRQTHAVAVSVKQAAGASPVPSPAGSGSSVSPATVPAGG